MFYNSCITFFITIGAGKSIEGNKTAGENDQVLWWWPRPSPPHLKFVIFLSNQFLRLGIFKKVKMRGLKKNKGQKTHFQVSWPCGSF